MKLPKVKDLSKRLRTELTKNELEFVDSLVAHSEQLRLILNNTKTRACKNKERLLTDVEEFDRTLRLYHDTIINLKTQIERIRQYKRALNAYVWTLYNNNEQRERGLKQLAEQFEQRNEAMSAMEASLQLAYGYLLEKYDAR